MLLMFFVPLILNASLNISQKTSLLFMLWSPVSM